MKIEDRQDAPTTDCSGPEEVPLISQTAQRTKLKGP